MPKTPKATQSAKTAVGPVVVQKVVARNPEDQNPAAQSRVVVIGAGPAGLMAAEQMANAGIRVAVYDAMPSVGRKFLRAGIGGLNLTHDEPWEDFVTRYGDKSSEIQRWLEVFGANELRAWVAELGVETFVGSSGRVFPVGNKAAPLLRAWIKRLQNQGVTLHTKHRWCGWDAEGNLVIESADGTQHIQAQRVIFALGGGSWARLGSDGAWLAHFQARGIHCAPFRPSNCGFDVPWTDSFIQQHAGTPLKSVVLTVKSVTGQVWRKQGDALISSKGIEGGLVYAGSALIRDNIQKYGLCRVYWDLLPDKTIAQIKAALAKRRPKDSVSNVLRKKLGLADGKLALLKGLASKEQMAELQQLPALIKNLPQVLQTPRPIDEAISTDGGVRFEGLTPGLSLQSQPHVYCVGEMLDWEAPTGGYLLTACFASGVVAGRDCAASLIAMPR